MAKIHALRSRLLIPAMCSITLPAYATQPGSNGAPSPFGLHPSLNPPVESIPPGSFIGILYDSNEKRIIWGTDLPRNGGHMHLAEKLFDLDPGDYPGCPGYSRQVKAAQDRFVAAGVFVGEDGKLYYHPNNSNVSIGINGGYLNETDRPHVFQQASNQMGRPIELMPEHLDEFLTGNITKHGPDGAALRRNSIYIDPMQNHLPMHPQPNLRTETPAEFYKRLVNSSQHGIDLSNDPHFQLPGSGSGSRLRASCNMRRPGIGTRMRANSMHFISSPGGQSVTSLGGMAVSVAGDIYAAEQARTRHRSAQWLDVCEGKAHWTELPEPIVRHLRRYGGNIQRECDEWAKRRFGVPWRLVTAEEKEQARWMQWDEWFGRFVGNPLFLGGVRTNEIYVGDDE